MKIIYCTHSTYNPGGMERVLLNKVTYLSALPEWEVSVVTTDQHQRPSFYPFPEKVRMTDLEINYSDDNDKGIWKKITSYLCKRKEHKRKLTALLLKEKPDIVVSLYPSESSFIPDIKDGSKKVLELHFNKFFRIQYGRKGIIGLIDRWRTRQDERIVRRFDKFVVLTNEDKGYWGGLPNIEVIPNAAIHVSKNYSEVKNKRVIAVGRLDYQKGFDRLIQAWKLVQHTGRFSDWKLDIFGQGEWREMLQQMIDKQGLQNTVKINPPTNAILNEYVHSSLLVMSSNYEGFGMVLVEAMSCGVPVISFDCKCGPKDIIQPGINGLLVPNGDIQALADAMMKVMEDEAYRKMLSLNARKVVDTYSEQAVMSQWILLFTSITAK
ncbi:glycosyltransferase family 4 protein [Phocaeicola plebeius]|jgi:glycosyltransferase involved in cell wall biosynthesis|uniref:glycosyltransferase family 4 protein n=2 Tax=Phocaeicola plebeius TaxID=310297 RepID=UPI000E50B4FC|nr:glycosyltransferase family 4 protein [Phocaeicola plebeius]RGQ75478.1 glycosyltransferase family 4 protein [Phocaeicola plebeius]RGQ95618.1 glycosyltransferase family 4 protein [Phocaeicola plebeius]RGZ59447.1 glycosyltransferase family 4 protein [Phocaeicola plebeius]